MSRIYFHTEDGPAVEVHGSERAYMGGFCNDLAVGLLGLDHFRGTVVDRLRTMIPTGHYLHAVREDRWGQGFATALRVGMGDDLLVWRGRPLDTFGLLLNTVLVVGNDIVRLMARLHGSCEIHCWVDGPNRAWLADLIDEGLETGLLRHGFWFEPVPGAERKWSDQGWEQAATLLRASDKGPVVTSYSVCDQFPNAAAARYLPPGWRGPSDWYDLPESEIRAWVAAHSKPAREVYPDDPWYTEDPTRAAEVIPTPEAYPNQEDEGGWYALSDEEQWQRAMEGLRSSGRGLELRPDNWTQFRFDEKLSVLDLQAPDYAERLDAVLGTRP